MSLKTLTAAALILATLPGLGFAQDRPARPVPVLDFATADANADGAISGEEWSAYSSSLMQSMRAEGMGMRADALIASGDANADGLLSRDELIAGMTAQRGERGEGRRGGMHGEGRGHHGDGEGQGWGRHGDGEGHGWGRHGGERGGERGRDGGRRGEMRGDGPMGGDRGFARIDDNGDGAISPEELARAQEFLNWMAQRPGRN